MVAHGRLGFCRCCCLSGFSYCVCTHTPASPLNSLIQIGSCTSQMGQIAIVSFQNSTPKVIECFNVESRILCMVHIPADEPSATMEPETPVGKALVPTICLGTEEGRWVLPLYHRHPRCSMASRAVRCWGGQSGQSAGNCPTGVHPGMNPNTSEYYVCLPWAWFILIHALKSTLFPLFWNKQPQSVL